MQLAWRLSHEEPNEDDDEDVKEEEFRKNTKCKIFLGYTSNLISAGVRETIRFLVRTLCSPTCLAGLTRWVQLLG